MTWTESSYTPMLILINGDSGLIRTRRIRVLHTLAFPLGYRVIDGEGQGSNLTSMKETIPQPLYHLSYFTYKAQKTIIFIR